MHVRRIAGPGVFLALFLSLLLIVLNMLQASAVWGAPEGVSVVPGTTAWSFVRENGGPADAGGRFVLGPGTPPLGKGSAELRANTPAGGMTLVTKNAQFRGQRLADFTKLSYSSYQQAGAPTVAVGLQFSIDYSPSDSFEDWQGRLVYEPYNDPNNVVPMGSWRTWNTLSTTAKWWASGEPGKSQCPQTAPCTWAQVLTNWPNARINPNDAQLLFKVGSGVSPSFVGFVDNLAFTVGGTNPVNTVLNFDQLLPTLVNPTTATAAQWGFAREGGGAADAAGRFALGPGTPPLGNGSAELRVNGAAGGMMLATRSTEFAGKRLADFMGLSFSTYQQTGNPLVTAALQLSIDYDPTDALNAWQGRLSYEPSNDLPGNPVAAGTWQTWNALSPNARWWASGEPGKILCPQTAPCTWAQVLANWPNARINPNDAQLLFKIGSGVSPSFVGYVDNLAISVAGASPVDRIFNFDQQTPIVVNATTAPGLQWSFQAENTLTDASGGFVLGPEAPPLGIGSARLRVNDSVSGMTVGTRSTDFAGRRLADFAGLSYSTYQQSGLPTVATALQFSIDYSPTDGNEGWQGRLVYEPYNDPNNVVSTGVWQTWNTLSPTARWWASGAPGNASCPQTSPCTWAQVLTNWPEAQIKPNDPQLLFKIGSGVSPSFIGYVDNLAISINGYMSTAPLDKIFNLDGQVGSTIVADNATATYNGTATLTATLTRSDTSAPLDDQTVTFTVNGTVVCGVGAYPACPYTHAGVATLSDVSLVGLDLDVGTYDIEASYAGDETFGVSSDTATLTITPASQSINFADLPDTTTYGNANLPLIATATSGQAVTFAVTEGEAYCAVVSGPALQILGAGACEVTASVGDDDPNYLTAPPVSQSLTIGRAALTLRANNASIQFGAAVPCAVTAVAPNTFVNGDNVGDLGTPTCTTVPATLNTLGNYQLVPSGLSSDNYSITYQNGTLTVTKCATSITLTLESGDNDSVGDNILTVNYSDSVTYRAVLTTCGGAMVPSGPVQFSVGGTTIGSTSFGADKQAVFSGPMVRNVSAALYTVTAVFTSNDVRFNGSSAAPQYLKVEQEAATATNIGATTFPVNAVTKKGTVQLKVSVTEVADTSTGDIRTAKVRFVDANGTPVNAACANVSVTLVGGVGQATCSFQSSAATYNLTAEIFGNYIGEVDLPQIKVGNGGSALLPATLTYGQVVAFIAARREGV